MVAFAGPIGVSVLNCLASHFFDKRNRLEHRNTVLSAAAEVVHLSWPRVASELFESSHHVVAVNVVTNLFALVSEDRVVAACERHLHQVRKKPMKLDAGVLRTSQTASAKDAYLQTKIA